MKVTMELSTEEIKKLQELAGFHVRDTEEAEDAIRDVIEKANQIKVKDANDFREAIIEVVNYMAFGRENVCAPSEPIEVEWGLKGTASHEGIKNVLPIITLVDRTEY